MLRTYGSFPVPLLLLKAAGSRHDHPLQAGQGRRQDGVPPVGDPARRAAARIARNSDAFFELQKWLGNGATRDGSPADQLRDSRPAAAPARIRLRRRCAPMWPPASTSPPSTPTIPALPGLRARRGADPGAELRVRHLPLVAAVRLLPRLRGRTATPPSSTSSRRGLRRRPPDTSRVPAPAARARVGRPQPHRRRLLHIEDRRQALEELLDWATEAGASPLAADAHPRAEVLRRPRDAGASCSAAARSRRATRPARANDFKLRPGSQGFFSRSALGRNYDEARRRLPRRRRARRAAVAVVKKPIRAGTRAASAWCTAAVRCSSRRAIRVGPRSRALPAPWTARRRAFCTVVEWHRLERADLVTSGPCRRSAAARPSRSCTSSGPRPGEDARLRHLPPRRRSGGRRRHRRRARRVTGVTRRGSLLGDCPGASNARDIRDPDVDYDGSRVVFAMRTGMADTLDLYLVDMAGTTCTKITDGNGQCATACRCTTSIRCSRPRRPRASSSRRRAAAPTWARRARRSGSPSDRSLAHGRQRRRLRPARADDVAAQQRDWPGHDAATAR